MCSVLPRGRAGARARGRAAAGIVTLFCSVYTLTLVFVV